MLDLALKKPTWGQKRVSNELRERRLSISAFGARRVWQSLDLQNMKKQLKALEAQVALDGVILTEDQLAALEKAKADTIDPSDSPPANRPTVRSSPYF
ncbi:MAG: hypothetical protein NXI18_12645 [Alphaproteobacteria bacterium]|nr:hypothetical protein [Alphaproteobacteria bacterium]